MKPKHRDATESRAPDTADHQIAARIAGGDREAFAAAYRAHKDALFSIAAHLLSDRALAEDVVHDAFVALAHRAGSLRGETSLRAWLVACTLNRSRDLLRRRTIRARPVPEAATIPPEQDPDGFKGAGDDERDLVRAGIAQLPTEQREVVVLRACSALSFPAIAAVVDAPVDTVHSRWRYALARLRRSLATLEPTP